MTVAINSMMTPTNVAARLDFSSKILQGWRERCALALAGSIFVAICAHFAVPLPFTPVPFTFQPFAVLLVGMVMGPVAGFGALVAYLVEGILGLPVFTPVGAPGIARLFGPTGGYLLAYPFAAALAGWVPRVLAKENRFRANVLGGTLAMLLVYLCGATWFSHLLHLPFAAALGGTVVPFAAPDAVKVLVAAGMTKAIQRPPTHNEAKNQGSVHGI